eukprot:TRINITY_DN60861_c0_g1_i1.p1 TRINITY_DN60861_c0_g1~~TRINITY_DN60861_c0_g1_i1.p1  ORF type:complete len:962 (+),score=176.09 TRINITY_DN60861_c0_g1_i1:85-2886(+)
MGRTGVRPRPRASVERRAALLVAAAAGFVLGRLTAPLESAPVNADPASLEVSTEVPSVTGVPPKSAAVPKNGKHCGEKLLHAFDAGWFLYCGLVVCCITCAALASGLTMGLVSIDTMRLHVICEAVADLSDDDDDAERLLQLAEERDRLNQAADKQKLQCPQSPCAQSDPEALNETELRDRQERLQRKQDMRQCQGYSRRILPLVRDRHLLLVSLLLTNAVANEAMPIFLDRIVPTWAAVLLSVTFVLVFGEIVPSAVFTGSQQLRVAAYFTPFVWFLMYSTGPVAWPIARLLDWAFHSGEESGKAGADGDGESAAFSREELKAFIRMHGPPPTHSAVLVLRTADDFPQHQLPEAELRQLEKQARLLRLSGSGSQVAHHARFCTATAEELENWLQGVLAGDKVEGSWRVLREHAADQTTASDSSKRLHFNQTRAVVAFDRAADAELAERVVNGLDSSKWFDGWVHLLARYQCSSEAVRMKVLGAEECSLLAGCMDLAEQSCGKAATLLGGGREGGRSGVYMLPSNAVLDADMLLSIARRGKSRIPVYQVREVDLALDSADCFRLHGSGGWGEWNRVEETHAGWNDAVEKAVAELQTDGASSLEASRCITPSVAPQHHWISRLGWVSKVAGRPARSAEQFRQLLAAEVARYAADPAGSRVRITVYDAEQENRSLVCGMVLAKQLIVERPGNEGGRLIRELAGPADRSALRQWQYPLAVSPQQTLLQALLQFRSGGHGDCATAQPFWQISHLAIVTNNPDKLRKCWVAHSEEDVGWARPIESGEVRVLGMLTLEDVIEMFLGDIQDETDSVAGSRCRASPSVGPSLGSFAHFSWGTHSARRRSPAVGLRHAQLPMITGYGSIAGTPHVRATGSDAGGGACTPGWEHCSFDSRYEPKQWRRLGGRADARGVHGASPLLPHSQRPPPLRSPGFGHQH